MPPITRTDVRPVATPTPPAVTPATTEVTTSPTAPSTPAGLDAATVAGVSPSAAGTVLGGGAAAAGLARLNALAFAGSTSGLFALAPGRYPDAVGLDVVLKSLGSSREGQAAVKQLIGQFESTFGVAVPPALVTAALANPERLADVFRLSPQQMSAGVDALNAAHPAGRVSDPAPKQRFLPGRVDLGRLESIPWARPTGEVKELAPGLLRGDVPNAALSDEKAKIHAALAEVLDRLAENAALPAGDRFSVRYGGGEYTRLDTFVDALRADGYEVRATVEHRVANFAALLTRAPDGTLLDVPAPVMVTVDDGKGNAVPLPSIHSEIVFELTPGPDTRGPRLEGAVKWYQGVPNTGFFPARLMKEPAWCGKRVSDTFAGDDAARALELSGLLSDAINAASTKAGLAINGYGVTGVCNDSVSIIQHALTGRATEYPLLMRDESVLPELDARIATPSRRDDRALATLKASIAALPSDVKPNATQRERALGSIPWEPGREPFVSTGKARALLQAVP